MSAQPPEADSGRQRLQAAGYEVEVLEQHLLVRSVPYVTSERTIALGTLVCKYVQNGDVVLPPSAPGDDHQVWWIGAFPCRADGTYLTELVADVQTQNLPIFEGCVAQHRFSNKPDGWQSFPDHFEKMTHYVTVIQSQAKAIDLDADARTKRIIVPTEEDSVFRYADTASVRAEIVATSARLKLRKVAIVGLGGTGSYILDQVAKTPVQEIHLFDGDDFKQHNAFRAPGAATSAELMKHMKKVDYFLGRYDPMRRGITPHPYFLDSGNVRELSGFDFAFVCVDKGPARRVICEHLLSAGVPFIDVGMEVVASTENRELDGTCRVTAVTPSFHGHMPACIPMHDDGADALYRQNIQVSDLNALNAQLAIIKWKQLFHFYEDCVHSHQMTYTVAMQSLTRDFRLGVIPA